MHFRVTVPAQPIDDMHVRLQPVQIAEQLKIRILRQLFRDCPVTEEPVGQSKNHRFALLDNGRERFPVGERGVEQVTFNRVHPALQAGA